MIYISIFLIILALLLRAIFYALRSPLKTPRTSEIPRVRGLPCLGCVDFFSRRNDFIQECLRRVNDTFCEINLPHVSLHIIIAVF